MIPKTLFSRFISTQARLKSFRTFLEQNRDKRALRVIEAHSGLSALIAERASHGENKFDALWSSSLTSSTIKGKPDIEVVDLTQRLSIVADCMESSSLPVVFDGDTGGSAEIFFFTVRTLERNGVSAVVIEDKTGLKQNSLYGTERKQVLEDVDVFSAKLRRGKEAQIGDEFMIFARIEALIAGLGVEEALNRATRYVVDGKADGILIHSKEKTGEDVFEFMRKFRVDFPRIPVIAVPTTYNGLTEEQLFAQGIDIVIYANQLLRAAYPAMADACQTILKNGRSKELDQSIMNIKDIINLIPQSV